MKIGLTLTECETESLVQMSINHPWRDARMRAAGMLMLGAGAHPTTIAQRLGVSHQSVYNWRHGWELQGITGLMGGHAGGRPRALSAEMLATAITTARTEALTLKGIAERIEAIHQCTLPCSLETLGVRLRSCGFSFKRTRLSLKKTTTRQDSPPASRNLPVSNTGRVRGDASCSTTMKPDSRLRLLCSGHGHRSASRIRSRQLTTNAFR